jgi:hypothetical protein
MGRVNAFFFQGRDGRLHIIEIVAFEYEQRLGGLAFGG